MVFSVENVIFLVKNSWKGQKVSFINPYLPLVLFGKTVATPGPTPEESHIIWITPHHKFW